MQILRPESARAFLELARPLLAPSPDAEARHNLMLGIASTLVDQPDLYPAFHLWVALEASTPVGAALMTPPYNLVLAEPAHEGALDELLRAVREDGAAVPGLVGNVPYVSVAAEAWTTATGSVATLVQNQGVYALTSVNDVPPAPGAPRAAGIVERDLLLAWLTAFAAEAMPGDHDTERIERSIDGRFAGAHTGLWIWEREGRPVSLAGFGGRTVSGIRAGPVYTPPEHRRRGYATNLVAALSRTLLDRGHRACFLYTDLANPTSNAVYERIGYARVGASAEYRFDRP